MNPQQFNGVPQQHPQGSMYQNLQNLGPVQVPNYTPVYFPGNNGYMQHGFIQGMGYPNQVPIIVCPNPVPNGPNMYANPMMNTPPYNNGINNPINNIPTNNPINNNSINNNPLLVDNNVVNDSLNPNEKRPLIQSIYCASGHDCVKACIQNGKWGYPADQLIEVPKDDYIYNSAIDYLQTQLDNNQIKIPGIKNADEVIVQGRFTYKQADILATTGKLRVIKRTYINDIPVITCTLPIGLSTVVAMSLALYSGKSIDEALKHGIQTLITVGGQRATSYVVRAALYSGAVQRVLNEPIKQILIKTVGFKGSAMLVNPVRALLHLKPIHGAAAMSQLTKMVKLGGITIALEGVMIGVSTGIDLFQFKRGKTSKHQVAKNLVDNAASSVGGLAGSGIGAAIGTAILPGVGTVIGGIVGGVGAGIATNVISTKATSLVIKTDSHIFKKFVKEILEKKVISLATDYLLVGDEGDTVVKNISEKLIKKRVGVTMQRIRNCFKSVKNCFSKVYEIEAYAEELLIPYFKEVVNKRREINEQTFSGLL